VCLRAATVSRRARILKINRDGLSRKRHSRPLIKLTEEFKKRTLFGGIKHMKKMIRLITLTAMMVAVLATGVLTQSTSAQTTTSAATSGQDDDAARVALYKEFTAKYKTDKPGAYEVGKQYIAKYPSDNSAQGQFVKKWVAAYELDQQSAQVGKVKTDVAQLVKDQKYAEAYPLGKQFLATHPDDLATMLNTVWSGWRLSFTGNNASNAEAAGYARKAIELIEAGKTPVEGQPFTVKDETLGWLNYALGTFALVANSPDAAGYFIKAAQYEGFPKKDPQLYERLALVYQATEYTKLAEDYKTRFATDAARATPEGKAATDKLNEVIDRIIDAYARAVAYSSTDPKYAAKKADWTKQLTDFYKFRHDNTTTGLDQLIATVTTKPLPQPGQPVTSAAPATSSSTAQPATGGSSAATEAAAGTGTTSTTTTTTSTSNAATSTQPAGTRPAATTSTQTVNKTATPVSTKSKTTTTTTKTTKRP
jgi:hypothetical protein